jgi:hypothetical protein
MDKRRPAVALAAAHLLLVACGASGLMGLFGGCAPGRALQWYGAMSGADAGYNFFAPRVGSELRVAFVLTGPDGRRWEDDLTAGENQEVKLRVGSMTGLFPAAPEGEALRRDLAASWAATMFGRHPDADEVTVRVEVYEVPSMEDYRAGQRPEWRLVYTAHFARAGAASAKGPAP